MNRTPLLPSMALLLPLALYLAVVPAVAQTDLYDNGPTNGTDTAWTINDGFVVSDSFTLGSASTVSGVNFAAWVFTGDVIQSGEIAITSSEFGGTTYFDQRVNITQSACVVNQLGYNVCTESASFAGPMLNAGTYWLTLSNTYTQSGQDDPVYWDENSGPSSASENTVGTIPSESFTILGRTTSGTGGSAPEPSSIILLGSGVLGMAGMLRRKLF